MSDNSKNMMTIHDIVLYGSGPLVPNIPDVPYPHPSTWTATENTLGKIIIPQPARPEVVVGLAKLLPLLRDKLKADGKSLDTDEVLAMVWLEGIAAGAEAKK